MARSVVGFEEAEATQVALVGGKGANMAALSRIDGIRVPPGFCVPTDAFSLVMAEAPSIDDQLVRLSHLEPNDRETIRALSAEIRRTIEAVPIPGDVAAAITRSLARLGEHVGYAVRSSATAEDLPAASFAGQQDSYLNVLGPAAILQHVARCWASLFTDRAVTYRLRNGVDHRAVRMAVIVQQMAFPQVAGVLFTADPVSGNRRVVSVEASYGLGEALVSGRVNADRYTVRDREIIHRAIGTKRVAIVASPAGGTREQTIEKDRQEQPSLTDAQVVRLAEIGRRIEAQLGRPQDIEWCLVDDGFQIVQSRPITTLFPIPGADDGENHVYVSVGHGQMMTDAMKPLGLSFWQMTTPRPMAEAGGRLFVDVTRALASPASRDGLLEVMGRGDPLIRDALQTVLDRGDFVPSHPDGTPGDPSAAVRPAPNAKPSAPPAPIPTDRAIVADLIGRSQASIAALKGEIRTRSGSALLDFIRTDIQELRRILFDRQSHEVFMSAMEATWWLNEHVLAWLGEKNASDRLTQSVPDNITSEMGLGLLDVADAIRPHPEVVAFLRQAEDDGFLDRLAALAGGREARDAIRGWLDRYGMRGAGEIDITRPRWSEHPIALVPILLTHVDNLEPGAAARRFEQGRLDALKKEQELLERLRALPDGDRKAHEAKANIDRVRTFIGYREYPKYGMVSRYFVYKQALLEEAGRLVEAQVLRQRDDLFFLRFEEIQDVVRTQRSDEQLIRERRAAFAADQSLTPPRVLTSDGEGIAGAYHRDDLPSGALVGLAVSAGTIEGRARVILDMADAHFEAGDILVTAFTDPSWTPLFVAIAGLVTEVGGLLTHGAVIAREYGLPAVVGVEHATRLIRDGQRIRLHGTDGYVEIVS
jgi:pyruvate,water dikinase